MHEEMEPLPTGDDSDVDIGRLNALGYHQVLARQLGGFSNFALSLSIICILAGGVTSFHLGLCSVGGASIGLGWPVVGVVALAVAATMGQLASTFPTAGGLYHWAAILGGRGWGWATAWFNLAGLVTVLAAINVGTYRFAIGGLFPGTLSPPLDSTLQVVGVGLITISQAMINHLGISATARLTDFSGYWILGVATILTVCLLAFAPGLDLSRLVTFENFSGTAGGNVWPATDKLPFLFVLGISYPPIQLPVSMHRLTLRKKQKVLPKTCLRELSTPYWSLALWGGCFSAWSLSQRPVCRRRPLKAKEHFFPL